MPQLRNMLVWAKFGETRKTICEHDDNAARQDAVALQGVDAFVAPVHKLGISHPFDACVPLVPALLVVVVDGVLLGAISGLRTAWDLLGEATVEFTQWS